MASINQKDLEAISAYIDQALDSREQARLEERLKHEPELRAELNSLRRTRRILRSMPAMRAPRNFTLTPEMVGEAAPKQNRLLPATRFAFALASIFFVFTLVGNFSVGNFAAMQADQTSAYAVPAEGESEVMEAPLEPFAEDAVEEAAAAESAESLPAAAGETTIVEEPSGKELPAEGDGEPLQPTPEPPASGGSGVTEAAPGEEPAEESMQAMAAPTEESLSVAAAETQESVERVMDVGEESEDTAADTGAGSANDAAGSSPVEKTAVEPAPVDNGPNWWGIGAIISGLLALVTGGLSFSLRRK